VRDATGVGDPRAAVGGGLEALKEGGWLAVLVDTRALATEGGFRGWLAARGQVAATVTLPAMAEREAVTALLVRRGGGAAGTVVTIAPEAVVRDVEGQRRYLEEARARLRAGLRH
jgi:hypothetical protein